MSDIRKKLILCPELALLCALLMLVCCPGFGGETSEAERNALIQIDQDMDKENQLNWNTDPGDVRDQWDGVTWRTGLGATVYSINASGKSLTGWSTGWNSLSNLRFFNLSNNQIGDAGASGLGANSAWESLQYLYLSNNQIGDTGASGLGANTAWTYLTYLDLSNNQIGDDGASGLGANSAWGSLRYLFLSNNQIGDAGASGLAKNETWKTLDVLDLSNNQIGDAGASDIAANTTWNLSQLNLSNNQIGDAGASDIAANTTWNLSQLFLSNNQIGDAGASGLAKNETWKTLDVLDLSNNQIGDAGASDIAANTTWNLSQLNLSNNQIGDIGASDIAANTTWSLEGLNLSNNQIGDAGASALAENTAWTNLNELHLSNNQITRTDMFTTGRTWNTLNVNGNAIPLSQLFLLMGTTNLWLGEQNNVSANAFNGVVTTHVAGAGDFSAENVIGGTNTLFIVTRKGSGAAVADVDYTEVDGVITFLTPGDYAVTMTNEAVYSQGLVDYYDADAGEWIEVDFTETDNPYGQIRPLAVVTTEGILAPNTGSQALNVRVAEAGGSVNARRLAAGLDGAYLSGVKLDGELRDLYGMALNAQNVSDSAALNLINQMHLESVAGGMDAILTSSARPFMQRLHSSAGIRPRGNGPGLSAAGSEAAYGMVTGCVGGLSLNASAFGMGHFADMSSHDGYLGYDLHNYGGFVSLDKAFSEGRFGFALGYSHTKVDWDDYENETRSDNFNAGLYASRFFDSLSLTWQANFGYADAEHSRNLPSANLHAKSEYDMYWIGTGVEAGYDFDLGHCLTLTPALGLDYLHSHSGSFSENGSGTAGAHVGSQNRDTFEGRAGVTLAKSFFSGGARITPSLSLGVGYTMGDRQTSVDYRFQTGAANMPTFRAQSAELDRVRFMAGAGVDVAINERVSLEAVYQGDFQSDYDSHYFRVGVGVSF